VSKPTKPAAKYVSRARGRKLMRQLVRYLESRFGNPPRLPIYTAAKGRTA
jgi:hypothetical protein